MDSSLVTPLHFEPLFWQGFEAFVSIFGVVFAIFPSVFGLWSVVGFLKNKSREQNPQESF